MRRLGLLGGMSWESSVVYEKLINEHIRSALGGVASADLLIRSFNFADIEALQAAGKWDEAGSLLASAAKDLEEAGAEAIVLCTNTMHQVAPAITEATDIPLLHIVTATGNALQDAGVNTVLLLGTAYTMEQPFYKDALAREFGLDVAVPHDTDRGVIHQIIYDELVQGVVNEESREQVVQIIEKAALEQGIHGVIAGCTEIELLVQQDHISPAYFPTTTIHARYAAEWALGASEEV
jgi:aspartate racemase